MNTPKPDYDRQRDEEADWVSQTLAGHNNAFEFLVKRYERLVYHFLLVHTGDPEAARDLAQDSFLKAYERLHSLREPRKFAGWLMGIARNLSLAWRRSPAERRTTSLNQLMDEGWTGPAQASSQDSLEQQDRLGRLTQALSRLSHEDRALLTLRHLQGYEMTDLQETFGLKPSALKMRLKRAREKLAASLQRTENVP